MASSESSFHFHCQLRVLLRVINIFLFLWNNSIITLIQHLKRFFKKKRRHLVICPQPIPTHPSVHSVQCGFYSLTFKWSIWDIRLSFNTLRRFSVFCRLFKSIKIAKMSHLTWIIFRLWTVKSNEQRGKCKFHFLFCYSLSFPISLFFLLSVFVEYFPILFFPLYIYWFDGKSMQFTL